MENESRQKKKAAAGTKAVKDEDPYECSTDENTDAEADPEHPVPELPGEPALISAAVVSRGQNKCPCCLSAVWRNITLSQPPPTKP